MSEVHPLTRLAPGALYGCHSRSIGVGYWAIDRDYLPDGSFRQEQKFVRHAMSRSCRQFALWDTDPRCAGCTTPKDLEYGK